MSLLNNLFLLQPLQAGNATAVPLLLPRNFSRFQIRLNTLLEILGPLAKSIHNLESSHVTPGDVFLHWIAIVASIKRSLDDNASSGYEEFSQRTSKEIIRIINRRYTEMIDKGPTDMYLAAFLLDPCECRHILVPIVLGPLLRCLK